MKCKKTKMYVAGGIAPNKKNWIKEALAGHKPGTLHKQLGVPAAENIPMSKLKEAAKAGGKLGKRANLALTLRKITNKK